MCYIVNSASFKQMHQIFPNVYIAILTKCINYNTVMLTEMFALQMSKCVVNIAVLTKCGAQLF